MKVLIADKFADKGVEEIRKLGCDVTVEPSLKDETLREALQDSSAEVLVVRSTKVPGAMIKGAPNLELIIRAGSGYDTIDVEAASARGVRVCNCPGMNAVAVAELTIGLMIALDRRIVDETEDLRRGTWNKKEYSRARGLRGRTLGVIGLGRIGYEVAKRAKAFDMQILYSDVVAREDLERELDMRRVSFEALLVDSDFVTTHVPGGDSTKHLIGRRELALMKKTAFLVNCARGGIVDEIALDEALNRGEIAGAALDVYEIEPAATDTEFNDPIVENAHLVGTHHVGASTEQAQDAVAEETVRIISRFTERGELLHCVNPPEPQEA